MSVTLATIGLAGLYPPSMAQVGEKICILTGYDPAYMYYISGNQWSIMNWRILPGAAAINNAAAGLLIGTYRYRLRWKDSVAGTYSLWGPETSVTVNLKTSVITAPVPSGARGATHYIVERTTNGGAVFFPINVDPTTPNGTPIANNFTDNLPDSDSFSFRNTLGQTQGLAREFSYRMCIANNNRLFFAGAVKFLTAGCTATNGSVNVTGCTNITTAMVGCSVNFGDTNGALYLIATYIDATSFTLNKVYAGTTGAKNAYIQNAGNRAGWSEAGEPEYHGRTVVGGVENEVLIGDSEQITAIVGLGSIGLLWVKASRIYLHSYALAPGFASGGKIVEMATRRGALGPRSARFIDGTVYGIDQFGIWAAMPGGLPQEIGQALRDDWDSQGLDFTRADWFWIAWRPDARKVLFWVVEQGHLYANKAFVLDVDKRAFVSVQKHGYEMVCGVEMPDIFGRTVAVSYNGDTAGATGVALYYAWAHGIGLGDGVQGVIGSVMTGVVTSLSGADPVIAGAGWNVNAWAGAPMKLTRLSNESSDYFQIASNTATKLVLQASSAVAPVVGDTMRIGPVDWRVRTGRIDGGIPTRKKVWKQLIVRVRTKTSNIPIYFRAYADGQSVSGTVNSDNLAVSEDGITETNAGKSTKILSDSTSWFRYLIPLNGLVSTDIQLELFGADAGVPPEIMAPMEVTYDYDDGKEPLR